MLIRVRRFVMVLALVALALGGALVRARADDASSAIALVNQVHIAALDLSRSKSNDVLVAQSQVLLTAFDGPGIGKTVLGAAWDKASATERSDFVDALLYAIASQLAGRLQGTPDTAFVVMGTQVLPNTDILVKTRFDRPVRAPVAVDWRLHRCAMALCIIDVTVDGASVAVQERDDIAAQLASSGGSLAKVIAKLRSGQPTGT